MLTRLVLCLDGVGPAYLAHADTPTIDHLGRLGWRTVGQSAIPSVTNVNNVSIVTASLPASHGITSNYYLDRARGEGVYMEASEYILVPTIFEQATRAGRRSVLMTAKDKLRTLLVRGTSEAISAESPPRWLVEALGPPPPILSIEVNHWLLRAAAALCQTRRPDLLYVSTTDYAQHKHPPESLESQANLAEIDRLLAKLLDSGPQFRVVITADHGMVAKTYGLDLGRILSAEGVVAEVVPIIKDRYVAHHQNLGGAAYVLTQELAQRDRATEILLGERGVESVWNRDEAAATFHLYPERIGDLFVLATEETVFGALPSARQAVTVRSHGGLHTRSVPIVAYGVPTGPFEHNYQAASWIAW